MRVILATEDRNLRLAVYLVLSEEPGVEVVGTASDSSSLLALYSTSCPDVVLMDYALGDISVESTLTQLKDNKNPAHVIILGSDHEEQDSALHAGANQFVLKGGAPHEMVDAIKSV